MNFKVLDILILLLDIEIWTLATICDNRTECKDGSDEVNFNPDEFNTTSQKILILSSVSYILLYVALKLIRLYFCNKSDNQDVRTELETMAEHVEGDKVLESYERHHNDAEVIKEVNLLSMKIHTSNTVDEIRKHCKDLYKIEARVHQHDQAAIFCCLKTHFPPKICDSIIEAEFPGCSRGCWDGLEDLVRNNVIKCIDCINRS